MESKMTDKKKPPEPSQGKPTDKKTDGKTGMRSQTFDNTFQNNGRGEQNIAQGDAVIGKQVNINQGNIGILGDNAQVIGGVQFIVTRSKLPEPTETPPPPRVAKPKK
ncbi:MAG: hypothetical protein D3906_01115 [Candidatus Electrothrix sp. AUS1_2]|nr:hypothetical protein [Candidatus Electrothrix sp. AUS1_2]